MLLPELMAKIQEVEMISECPLTEDCFMSAFQDVKQMSARLTGRRHSREVSERLESIEAKQVNWLRTRTG